MALYNPNKQYVASVQFKTPDTTGRMGHDYLIMGDKIPEFTTNTWKQGVLVVTAPGTLQCIPPSQIDTIFFKEKL